MTSPLLKSFICLNPCYKVEGNSEPSTLYGNTTPCNSSTVCFAGHSRDLRTPPPHIIFFFSLFFFIFSRDFQHILAFLGEGGNSEGGEPP